MTLDPDFLRLAQILRRVREIPEGIPGAPELANSDGGARVGVGDEGMG